MFTHFPISNFIVCSVHQYQQDIKHLSVDSLCIAGEHDQAVYSLQKPIHLQSFDLKLTGVSTLPFFRHIVTSHLLNESHSIYVENTKVLGYAIV